MSRVPGTFNTSNSYEVTVRKPFDARTVVPTYADLTLKSNWINKTTNAIIAYNGLVVSVNDTSDISKNGNYRLFDPAVTSALKSPDVTNPNNWHKLADTNDVYLKVETYSKHEVDTAIQAVSTDISDIKLSVQAIQNSLEGIGNKEGDIYLTVLSAIDSKIADNNHKLPIATTDLVGGIKSNTSENKITVLPNGDAEVSSLNVNRLVQTAGDILIFDGQLITV